MCANIQCCTFAFSIVFGKYFLCVMQLLCKSVQDSSVMQTMQLIFSGADVSFYSVSTAGGQKTCLYCDIDVPVCDTKPLINA